jgi:predicted permease
MGLEGVVRGVIIIQASMPIAVFNFLFAERYGRSPESVASAVVLSTLLAFVLLPFLLEWAL